MEAPSLPRTRKLLQVHEYRQTLPRGCGPSSFMIVMNALRPEIEVSPAMEQQLYEYSKFAENATTSTPRLATYALERGFTVKLYSDRLLPGKPQSMPRDVYDAYLHQYQKDYHRAKSLGLEHEIIDLSSEKNLINILLREIYADHFLIAFIKLDNTGDITHNVCIRGHKGKSLAIMDPAEGYQNVPLSLFMQQLDVPYYKSLIAIGIKP